LSTEKNILTNQATEFVSNLCRQFSPRLADLLEDRKSQQKIFDAGATPGFNPDTQLIRESDWKIDPVPHDIQDRRVEITGPPERKMVINALNSGANVFMADFEDSLSPTWENLLEGQQNLYDAVRGRITYNHPTKGLYQLNENPAVLFVRPRGLHLSEAHFLVDGDRCPAALFDFGLYMCHNAKCLVEQEKAPYFYLPKLESFLEARWWNDVFNFTQDQLGIPRGTIKATVLLETLPAAFQMNELLWELRHHSAGLNCGRWDYIFSYIKTFQNHPDRVTPDRGLIGMTSPFMDAYSKAVIQICHKRGAHAMGGMAAQIPIRNDEEGNMLAMTKVCNDKLREVQAGHDGTWVAHPGLVSLAGDIFDEHMPQTNQIDKVTNYTTTDPGLLLAPPEGEITLEGLKQNIDVGIRYLSSWLSGNGCVPLYNLMEDAATAEISRTQVWQWLKYQVPINDGTAITYNLVGSIAAGLVEEDETLREASKLFLEMCERPDLESFLTLTAYERIKNG